MVTAVLVTVNPLANITFYISNPLGFDDVFDIGKPEYEIGAAFGCSDTSMWKPRLHRSKSGKSVGYVEYDFPSVINTNSDRDTNNPGNRFQLKFSLMAMQGADIGFSPIYSLSNVLS